MFDGKAPLLKKQTLERRRRGRSNAEKRSHQTRMKIIENHLKSQAVRQKLRTQTQVIEETSKNGQEGLSRLLNQRKKEKEKDLFELPPLIKEENESSESETDDILSILDIDRKTDIHQVDINDPKFKSLSKNEQAEALMELREKRKQNSWAKLHEMPREANNFSGFQMDRLLKVRYFT